MPREFLLANAANILPRDGMRAGIEKCLPLRTFNDLRRRPRDDTIDVRNLLISQSHKEMAMHVLDAMSTDVLTIGPDESLKAAARMMLARGVSGLPVVDTENKLIGIVTEADFVRQEAERSLHGRRRLLDTVFGDRDAREHGETVGDVMTPSPLVVTADARIAEAARIMNERLVKRLPVVDSDGVLIGIVSRADIVAAYVRPDDVIEDAVREDIMKRVLMIEPDALEVSVKDGIVSVAGRVDSQMDAQLLEELIWRLEGVVRADIDVAWPSED
jgi:CBS domain-containing protein